jgi:hypothetical protein
MVDQRLDPEIAPLVEALRMDEYVETLGSCCGHGRNNAYVGLAVRGMDGLAKFVGTLNRLRRLTVHEVFLDVILDWSAQSATACYFEKFPDWIMLSLEIEGPDGPPTERLLRRVAAAYYEAGGRPVPDGTLAVTAKPPAPVQQEKVGRNAPCPCGSGVKFKKCCGAATST